MNLPPGKPFGFARGEAALPSTNLFSYREYNLSPLILVPDWLLPYHIHTKEMFFPALVPVWKPSRKQSCYFPSYILRLVFIFLMSLKWKLARRIGTWLLLSRWLFPRDLLPDVWDVNTLADQDSCHRDGYYMSVFTKQSLKPEKQSGSEKCPKATWNSVCWEWHAFKFFLLHVTSALTDLT